MQEELNMQEFSISEIENEQAQTYVDPLDELVSHDFSSDEEINLDESYEMIGVLENEVKKAKINEAEEIINELSDTYLTNCKEKITKSIDNVKAFIKKYNIEKEEVKSLNDSERTKLYGIGSFLLKNVTQNINEMIFDITLTRSEYKFIHMALSQKLSYDGNEVFNIIELNNNYLLKWKEMDRKLPKDIDTMVIDIDIRNVVMMYHFLGKHTVKGLGAEFYDFASVLQKIGDTNRLFNAYNILQQRLNTDFSIWSSALEPNETLEEVDPGEVDPQLD
jgi:hypothetical protein